MTMEVAVTPSYISKLHQLKQKFLSSDARASQTGDVEKSLAHRLLPFTK